MRRGGFECRSNVLVMKSGHSILFLEDKRFSTFSKFNLIWLQLTTNHTPGRVFYHF